MIKAILKGLLKRILFVACLLKPQNNIRILFYHSIDDSGSLLSTAPGIFEKQMAFLNDHGYQTISLYDYIDIARKGNSGRDGKFVVITFDDGFENNYTRAFPVLKKYGFTATIFLATDYINGSAEWIKRDIEIIHDRITSGNTSHEKHSLINNIHHFNLMNWGQISEMSRHGIDFGVHTASHAWLRDISVEEAREDMVRSRSLIEHTLNRKVDLFSYPYSNFTPEIKQLVKELGFVAACSGSSRGNASGADMYDLERVSPYPQNSLFEFKFLFSSGFDRYVFLKGMLKEFVGRQHNCRKNT